MEIRGTATSFEGVLWSANNFQEVYWKLIWLIKFTNIIKITKNQQFS